MTCSYHNIMRRSCSAYGARATLPGGNQRSGFRIVRCIVAGVELLSGNRLAPRAQQVRRALPSGGDALSHSPGLGAAYNGQTSKALVHFALFASCWHLAAVTDAVSFFVLGALGVWLFAAVDSYRTAQLISAGLAPNAESDPIARRLYGHPLAWAFVLIALGSIFLLNTPSASSFRAPELPSRSSCSALPLFDFLRSRRERDALTDGSAALFYGQQQRAARHDGSARRTQFATTSRADGYDFMAFDPRA